jgi:hypothetical protein
MPFISSNSWYKKKLHKKRGISKLQLHQRSMRSHASAQSKRFKAKRTCREVDARAACCAKKGGIEDVKSRVGR